MVRLEFNGKPFDPNTFHDQLMAAMLQQVVDHIHEQVSGIRDPDTGEFPTVVIRATSLSDMQLHVEGSDALIAQVREALGTTEEESDDMAQSTASPDEDDATMPRPPKVFLSYASEDRPLAGQIAQALIAQGIDTWWDTWEIRAGDSVRQKIDAGLGDCTHFLVLLTPIALTKPWVNQEMDAGFVRMLDERVVFLPVRSGLPASSLPPLLRGVHSPEIRDHAADIQQLIHDIHGITRKPPLGPAPVVASRTARTGVSAAATAVVRAFVEHTKQASGFDPQFSHDQLQALTGLSRDDLADAIHELRGRVKVHGYTGAGFVVAEPVLYAEFDAHFQPWDPAKDARQLAADLHNDPQFPVSPSKIAERYDWSPRRLNPALAYLMDRKVVHVDTGIGDGTYLGFRVRATDATRRFVKSQTAT